MRIVSCGMILYIQKVVFIPITVLMSFPQLGQDINGEYSYDYSGRSVSLSSDGNIVII